MGDVAGGGEADVAEEDDELDVEDDAEELNVQEHLKDAIDGSLRLKRLLSRDDDTWPNKKKRKIHIFGPEETARVNELLKNWRLEEDYATRYVLEQLPMEELEDVAKSSFKPYMTDKRSPSDQCAKVVAELRERKIGAAGLQDAVRAFMWRHRSTLDKDSEVSLRRLAHKDLRCVLDEYDGVVPLEEVIEQAANSFIEDEHATEAACADCPGAEAIGRIHRLDLIDPLTDCAVFGDANLTFALKLAKHRHALGHVGRTICTTFEELETLRERYKEIDRIVNIIEEHYGEVFHGVDCTRIALDPNFEGVEESLGAVYYNFPHSGVIQGFFDGHPLVNWRHENLMRLFFRALRSFVKPGGVVKIASNANAQGVRYSYILTSAMDNEFVHEETFPFLEWRLHRYGRSYGDKRDSYKRPDAEKNQSYADQSEQSDMVYCFRYKPSGKTLPPQQIRLPPTLKTLMQVNDGPFKALPEESKATFAKTLHSRFVTEVSGTHVG